VIRLMAISLASSMLALACSTTGPPREELARAAIAVGTAEDAGAQSHASAEWARARQKLDEAQAATASKEYVRARRLAEQAFVDAELAAAISRSEVAMQHARELRESIETLHDETRDGGPSPEAM